MLLGALDALCEIDTEIDETRDEFGKGVDFDSAVNDVKGCSRADQRPFISRL